ncbi:MAG: FHA domain-containing protein [Deltaproteobacteria bacterium]|nr:FHA domain-containing protein [Deltaproteobacteria bacterium]
MAATAHLVIHHADGDTFYLLTHPNIVLGRVDSADVVLHDAAVSRVHARVVELEGVHHVMDLSSRTGTRVNGRAVDEYGAPLLDGDSIQVGNVRVTYRRGAPG